MKTRYVHTNIVAKDWKKLSAFYQRVFGCRPVPPRRDLCGGLFDRVTGIENVHIEGEHLALPGYDETLPTLEIFSYNINVNAPDAPKEINGAGFAHIAFEVDDVQAVLNRILAEGGGQAGELIRASYPGGVILTAVYARDIEGNIIELQNWEKSGEQPQNGAHNL